MKTVEHLRKARKLIDAGWTRDSYARDDKGHTVDRFSDSATCFCALGALDRVVGDSGGIARLEDAFETLSSVLPARCNGSVVDFNDRVAKDKDEVLAAFDRAIAEEESRE